MHTGGRHHRSPVFILWESSTTPTMFTSITDRKAFGATYQWAVLSVLPMDEPADRQRPYQWGLSPSEINRALGMPKEARTTVSLLLKQMASDGLVQRYEYRKGLKQVCYRRILPLRKRERIARWIWGS